jgi:hypothetical protein
MNVIFGSGLIGLLAKAIFPSWKIIPFYRSRFFSYNPALDDNYIVEDTRLDSFVKDLMGTAPKTYPYSRAYSISGHLVKEYHKDLCEDWLYKIFGVNYPNHAEKYFSTRMTQSVYNIRLNQLYQSLTNKYIDEIKEEAAKGAVESIGDHYFVRNGNRVDFDNAISTIPLDSLQKLMGITSKLESKPVHYLHVRTRNLDFEGANQVFVVDKLFGFYKVINIAPERYMIYCNEDIPQPGAYFMAFMQNFDIIDGTSINGVIPIGNLPNTDDVVDNGIFCVGSYAEWDWCADVGSCILRLLGHSQRHFKPKPAFKPNG